MSKSEYTNRLLLSVELEPVQGKRFQPTGFPDLGAAEIPLSSGTTSLLVESPQSMAKRMQLICLNERKDDFVDPLKGLSMIIVKKDKKHVTNSVAESHKIASYYIVKGKDTTITDKLEALEEKYQNGVNVEETAKLLFELDINSLLHGVWASQVKLGRIKVARALSAYIEADNVKIAISGGVKKDDVNPQKDEEGGGSEAGQGHIPFSRIEYTAESITAYFNLDLEQIKSYNLDEDQTELLKTLALWKIRTFLDNELRLRTACDLKITKIKSDKFVLPEKSKLDLKIRQLISKCTLKQTEIQFKK